MGNFGFWQYFAFSGGKLGPKMNQNCKLWDVLFKEKFKILKNPSNTVFILWKITSAENVSQIELCLGEKGTKNLPKGANGFAMETFENL